MRVCTECWYALKIGHESVESVTMKVVLLSLEGVKAVVCFTERVVVFVVFIMLSRVHQKGDQAQDVSMILVRFHRP